MTVNVTPTIEALRPYEAGKPVEELARELGISGAIKLASNENPLGPSPRALDAAREALLGVGLYPDAAAYSLRQRLAAHHGVTMEEIVQANGSNEILTLLYRTFTTGADHVVFGQPAFVVYQLEALAHGVPYTAVPLADWVHDLPAMAAAVTPRTRLLFIANPNNPTGTHVGRDVLEALLREVPEDVIVVVDEAYVEYAEAPDFVSALELRHLRENLVVVRTFSKAYGLASLRVGYGVFPRRLADYVHRVRAPFNVNGVAQAAALAALGDQEHIERTVTLNRAERIRVAEALRDHARAQGLQLRVVDGQTNFLFLVVPGPGQALYEQLLRRGVIVRAMGPLPFIRVTLGTESQNDRFIEAFQQLGW